MLSTSWGIETSGPTPIVELARDRPKAHSSVDDEVGYDRGKILRMPIGGARDRRP